jgi:hypothetical protein
MAVDVGEKAVLHRRILKQALGFGL